MLIFGIFLFSIKVFGQEVVTAGEKDNVQISYQLTLLEENNKKDKYLISISTENKNDYDLFYALPLNSEKKVETLLPTGFSKITIRNSMGWFGDGKQIIGQETVIRTENNEILMMLEKQKTYNFETDFNVKHGEKPIVTNSYIYTLRKLNEFNVSINDAFVNGIWQTTCGNGNMSLSLVLEGDVKVIIQSVNGKQFRWLKQSASNFVRENDTNSTLTYNKNENKFYYTSSDGNNCEWTKK